MKHIDVKQHTQKYRDIAKQAAAGAYPNQKAARIGSVAGLGLGCVLLGVGAFGTLQGAIYGVGGLVAGSAACISNAINLIRIKKHA